MPTEKVLKKKKPCKELVRSNNVVVKHPTSKSAWKTLERIVADFFHTKRVPLSGSNSGHNTNSDSMHPKLYIECKLRQRIALWSLFKDTEKKAENEGKIPVVAIKEKGGKGVILLIRPEHLQEVAKLQSQETD